ncbi:MULTISPECIES: hypothetical protein [Roseomonadaceae]|jgi:hypothetical protein|uniref:Uncharacterized protein n=1 Tax=Muricoccus pecuniae TaxID=693023 RepID=A0A840Y5I7_9PROT|nr:MULTISPECIES: hypothetical protein [Roseomonas]MBB5696005.1 hypothetical protein [Roseomonas pecuniae]USQ74565.1 hypothetical protein NF552_25045 [Roseomonas mucosa]
MKLVLSASGLAAVYGFGILPASARAPQPVPQCTAVVTGRDGRNVEAEQVVNALRVQGCAGIKQQRDLTGQRGAG